MSTIAGVLNADGAPVDRGLLHRMAEAGVRPGAEIVGLWLGSGVGLAATGPVPGGRARPSLPLVDPSSGIVVALDGHLHAREELRRELNAAGVESTSTAEAALIARAYEAWGERCARYLSGEYTFALWDPSRRKLLCARDSAGVRPLFYCRQPLGLRLATSVKQLLEVGDLSRKGDCLGMLDFLVARGSLDEHRTPLAEVKRLPAAHTLVWDGPDPRIIRHWSVDEEPEIELTSTDDYADALADALKAAIHDRVAVASRAGLSLSGGYDSGTLFVLWQWLRSRGESLPAPWWSTFYWEDPEGDERQDVKDLVDRWPAEGTCLPAAPEGFLDGLDEHTRELGLPEVAFGWRCLRRQGEAARGSGVRVLLSGEAGNHVAESSILRAADLLVAGRISTAARQVQVIARELGVPVGTCAWDLMLRPAVAKRCPALWHLARRLRRVVRGPRVLLHYLTPTMQAALEELQVRNRPQLPPQHVRIAAADKRRRLEMLCRETYPLASAMDLEGVMLSAPYLDRRVIRISRAALAREELPAPSRALLTQMLKRTAQERLSGNRGHGTRSASRGLVRAIHDSRAPLMNGRLVALGIVEARAVGLFCDRFVASGGYDGSWLSIWLLLTLETWTNCTDVTSAA